MVEILHLWARGYLAGSSGNLADEMILQYIKDQEGELLLTTVDFNRPPLESLD
jgi:hypothetical protein